MTRCPRAFAALHRQITRVLKTSANALHRLGKSFDAFPRHRQMQAFADVEGVAVLSNKLPSNSPQPRQHFFADRIDESPPVAAESCSASPDPSCHWQMARRTGLPVAWSRCSQRHGIRHAALVISNPQSASVSTIGEPSSIPPPVIVQLACQRKLVVSCCRRQRERGGSSGRPALLRAVPECGQSGVLAKAKAPTIVQAATPSSFAAAATRS